MNRIAAHSGIYLILPLLLTTPRPESQISVRAEISSQTGVNLQILPEEEMYLHIDRDKYIAGEDIWFSIYTADSETGRLSSRSIIAYVELINPWNIPVIQTRFQLSGGKGEGSFLLPDSISSGTYIIRAYTNRMKNFLPDYCYMQDIAIYNPFKGSNFLQREKSVPAAGDSLINPGTINTDIIDITLDSIYGRRQKVLLDLRMNNEEIPQRGTVAMSISVTPSEFTPVSRGIRDILISDSESHRNPIPAADKPERFDFESDGHFLSFLVKYRGSSYTDSSDFLYMSIQGKVAEFNYAGKDSSGRFTFLLPVDSRLRNLVIQPEHATDYMTLEIEPSFSRILPDTRYYRDELNDSQLNLFSGLSFNYQASRIYNANLKNASETDDDSTLKRRRFYGIPEMEIFLNDYIKLPTIQEVFFELIPGIIIRSGKQGYELKITNPLTGVFYEETPLVMIDGVIINDLTVLVDLDPDLVEKIEVVKTPYLIGDLILHGIVNVITREGNFSSITMPDYAVILPYRIVGKPPVFASPEYSDELRKISRIPDLRNTLYWNPSVKTNSNGEAAVEFWTSDLTGSYTINIQGITETGEKISLYRRFVVR